MQTPATLFTQQHEHGLNLRVARSFWSRFAGLMLRAPLLPGTGFLIPRCTSVHTCFMRYALDLVYLDHAGRVTHCAAHIKPWRMHWPSSKSSRGQKKTPSEHVLELPAGSIKLLNIELMNQLKCPVVFGAVQS